MKELRLCAISGMADGNAFLPMFMEDYNRRFRRAPREAHDAHRPLRGDEGLDHIFARQENRRLSGNLTVHFKRRAYLVTPTPETLPLGGKTVRVHEWEDGRVELHCEGCLLPYSIFDKAPIVSQGAIVENKRLGDVLAAVQVQQLQRDQPRLTSKTLSLREKERLRQARERAQVPIVESRSKPRNRTSLLGFDII